MGFTIKEQRLIGVGILFIVLFNFPIVQAFNPSEKGSNYLFIFLFAVWAVLIAVLYFILKKKG